MFKSQQEARGKMATRLAAEYKEAEDNLEERIERAQKEKEIAAEKRAAAKEAKRKRELDQISKHLGIQLQVKGEAKLTYAF